MPEDGSWQRNQWPREPCPPLLHPGDNAIASEKLVGKDVRHKSKQVTDRQAGKKKVIYLPKSAWIWRAIPHLPILSDELAEAVHRKLGKRLNDRLAKLHDTHLDAVLAKAEETGRQLAAKRERLKELQRSSRRPNVKSLKEKDVVAALTQLRDLLQSH